MSYDQIKTDILNKQKENIEITRRIQSIERDLEQSELHKRDIEQKMRVSLENSKKEQLESFCVSRTSKIKEDIGLVSNEIVRLKSEYRESLDSCNEDLVYEELKKSSVIPSEIGPTMEELKSLISQDIGERFVEKYLSQVQTRNIKLDSKVLSRLYRRFTNLKSRLSKIKNRDGFSVFDKAANYLNDVARNNLEERPKGILIFAGTAVAGMALLSWVVFPAYVLFLCTDFALRVRRSSVYSRAIKECKIVSDNLDRIDLVLRNKAKEETERMLSEIEKNYEEKIVSSEKRKSELEALLVEETNRAEREFVFDDSAIRSTFEISLSEVESTKSRLSTDLSKLREQQSKLLEEIQNLKDSLKQEVDNIKLKYLDFDKVGEELLYNDEFLVDVKGDKPIMFSHNKSSCLFFYEDVKDVTTFVRLICTQLRARLNPFSLKIQVWDKDFMGISFAPFYKKQTDLFSISVSKEDIDESLKELSDMLIKRSDIILKEHDDIDHYNKHMIELDSVTEYYSFLFIINPDKWIADDYKFGQILSIGPSVGIYPFVFIDLAEIDKEIVSIVKKVKRFYSFERGEISKKAEQYVLEELVKFGD